MAGLLTSAVFIAEEKLSFASFSVFLCVYVCVCLKTAADLSLVGRLLEVALEAGNFFPVIIDGTLSTWPVYY